MAQISGNVNHGQALKQAEDYVRMDRKDQSFQFLYEYIMSAKKRGQWSGVFEKIMNLFVDLAIQQEKYSTIKDGLLQYRYMSQLSNSESLQQVMEHFRDAIEDIFYKFIANVDPKLIESVDVDNDDDLVIACEDSTAVAQEIELKNQIRQLIETYKIILENVRLNNKLEPIFVSTVEKWVGFCKQYKRKAEIKKLIDFQRSHLNKLIRGKQVQGQESKQVRLQEPKQQQVQNQAQLQYQQSNKNQMSIDISQPNYNNIYQNVFTIQLDSLIEMGLWQEAFRTAEDIQNIRRKRKEYAKVEKNDKVKLEMIDALKKQQAVLSQAYNKHLSAIFQKSNMKHFQAFSFFQYFETLQNAPAALNEHLVLSVLTVNKSSEKQLSNDLMTKLASHLNNGQVNSKDEMVQLIRTTSILEVCSAPVVALFRLLEDDFSLQKYRKSGPYILESFSSAEYSQYLPAIQEVVMVKVVQCLSKVYRVMKLAKLQQLISFYDLGAVQRHLLVMNQKGIVQTKIDQAQQTVKFWEKENSKSSMVNFMEKIVQVGQDMKSLAVAVQRELSQKQLQENALQYVDDLPNMNKAREAKVAYTKNPQTFQDLQKDQLEEERQYMLQYEQKKRDEEQQRLKNEENLRLTQQLQEALLKNKQRAIEEIVQIKKKQVAKINDIPIEKLDEDDLVEIDLDTIQELKEKVKTIMKENVDNKNIRAFKKQDYIVRKRREEEFKIIKNLFTKQELDIKGIQQGIADEHARNVELKHHLQNAQQFKEEFLGQMLKAKEKLYEENIQQFRQKLSTVFKQRILELAKEKRENDLKAAEARRQALQEEQARIAAENKDNKKSIQPSFIYRSETAQAEGNKGDMESLITTTGPIQRGTGIQAAPSTSFGIGRSTDQPGFTRSTTTTTTEQTGFSRSNMRKEEAVPMRRAFVNDNKPAGPIKREDPKPEEKPKTGARFYRN